MFRRPNLTFVVLLTSNFASSYSQAIPLSLPPQCSPLVPAHDPYHPDEPIIGEASFRIAFSSQLLLQCFPEEDAELVQATDAGQLERCNGGQVPPFCLMGESGSCNAPIRIVINASAVPPTINLVFQSSVFGSGSSMPLFSRAGVFGWLGYNSTFPASHVWTFGTAVCPSPLALEQGIGKANEEALPLCTPDHFGSTISSFDEGGGKSFNTTTTKEIDATVAIDGSLSSPESVVVLVSIAAEDFGVGVHVMSVSTAKEIEHDSYIYTLLAPSITIDVHVHEVPRIKYLLKPTDEVVYESREEEIPMLKDLSRTDKWQVAVESTAAEFESFLRNDGRVADLNVLFQNPDTSQSWPDFETDTWTMAQVEHLIFPEFELENDVETVLFRHRMDGSDKSWEVYRRQGFLCGQCDARNTHCNGCTFTEHVLVHDFERPFRVYDLDAIDGDDAAIVAGSISHVQPGSVSILSFGDEDDVNYSADGSGNDDDGLNDDTNHNGSGGSGIGSGGYNSSIGIGLAAGGVSLSVDGDALEVALLDAADAVVVLADSNPILIEDHGGAGNTSNWAVLPRSQVGASCGKLGVTRAAFLAQPGRCNAESKSCTGPRLADLVSKETRANITTPGGRLEEGDGGAPNVMLVFNLNARLEVNIRMTRADGGNGLQQRQTRNNFIFAEPRLHQLGAGAGEESAALRGGRACQGLDVNVSRAQEVGESPKTTAEGQVSIVLHNFGDAAGTIAIDASCTAGVTLFGTELSTHVLTQIVEPGFDSLVFEFPLSVSLGKTNAACNLTAAVVSQPLWSSEGKMLPTCTLDVSGSCLLVASVVVAFAIKHVSVQRNREETAAAPALKGNSNRKVLQSSQSGSSSDGREFTSYV
eukprot:gene2998-17847_t